MPDLRKPFALAGCPEFGFSRDKKREHMINLKDKAQARTCFAHLPFVLHFFSNRIMKLVFVQRLIWLPKSRQRRPQHLSW